MYLLMDSDNNVCDLRSGGKTSECGSTCCAVPRDRQVASLWKLLCHGRLHLAPRRCETEVRLLGSVTWFPMSTATWRRVPDIIHNDF